MTGDPTAEVLRAAMRAISEGVLVWTATEGRIVTCNEAAASILGEPRTAIEGRTLDYPWQLGREDCFPRHLPLLLHEESPRTMTMLDRLSHAPRLAAPGTAGR